ncbi:alanine--tRNA ligase [Parvicella tangerina]|uniref:Alanine--tRNA ligase n=1 Tax=Parvicella tangerina TaxID=2829795 RepID=A0A916JL28_9FLAO|nr:alanine--tRNA ligase [Parvicella tangerina]CAG5076914.1 Alanine--tRNA ligase [Parvicella tangerina]
MKSVDIRKAFLAFFESKGHKVVPSAPMVIKDDPTLMFTNAGMNQFKDLFLGNSAIKDLRVANSQKCLRVSGKHNDLEEVGVDTYHHTMFEMLGNWSFGDYFKEEAIEWAWELLTDIYKLDKDRLYVTVFEGDSSENLKVDQEAIDLWKQHIAEDRILMGNKKDNFWEMGDVGPCGPCSEIHIDLRSAEERMKTDGATLVNMDHPQVIEIWNLVFMQYNRMKDQSLVPLKSTHIDTGMGFERLAMALQGKTSNYDTDIFMPLINKIEDLSGLNYKPVDEDKHKQALEINIAMRVIADHIRAIAFSIADGQLPSNNGAGYVIRRILRRAVRYGYQTLNLKEPFLCRLVPTLANQMGEAFPELNNQKMLIEKVIREEEISFFRTLETGLKRIDQICINLNAEGKKEVPGEAVFELYDTYGFPVDLTNLIAQGYEMTLDQEGFEKALEEQKNRSRKAAETDTSDWVVLKEDDAEEFIGYDYTEGDVYITRYREVTVKDKTIYQLVFSYTPFYPEGGGQIGDTGYIELDGEKTFIFDTKKENNLILHFAKELPKVLNGRFKAVVNSAKRKLTSNNHTATHLVHAALRTVLGEHVEQKGSLVTDKSLRFDFSHFSKVTPEEIKQVEDLVNQEIRANHELEETRQIPLEKAREAGAMMLFGEKYADVVRMIKFGDSIELCGGIHVPSTSQIGTFKIINEGSVAAGIRRIEAITSEAADQYINDQLDTLASAKETLKNPKDLTKAIHDLLEQNSKLQKEVEALKKEQAKGAKDEILKNAKEINGIKFISAKVALDAASVKDIAYQIKGQEDSFFFIVGSYDGPKAMLTIMISDDLVKEKGLHAGNIIRELAKEIGGGGGGQPFFATAGGKNPDGIENALTKAEELL